ncbi:hypothetical protein [uncultured Lacinutrix sp.]|uniref:hypothetical protein n=1 Tax=uncultured Lacinutrix sp. TaxID=574032 RepID=UPI00262C7EC9|nr:hypothetical protein [uncultured Lacinutrix sp.]
MKSIKMVLLVLAITFTGTLSATTNPDGLEPNVLANEITALLKNPEFKVAEDLKANVTFMLNKNNEIVVINVDTESEQLESYIKTRLNYSKLKEGLVTTTKTYKIPVRITIV